MAPAVLNLLTLFMFAQSCCVAKLIDAPKSTSSLLGETASFTCSGFGSAFWFVNGVQVGHHTLSDRGIMESPVLDGVNGSVLSMLNVSATAENNNINISCVFLENLSVNASRNAVLTVLGVDVVQNMILLVDDNSTQLSLTWEGPFHSQDVIALYYSVSVVNLDIMNELHENTISPYFRLHVVYCGLYRFTVTTHGDCAVKNCTYVSVPVTLDHNVMYAGVYQLSLLESSIEIEYQSSNVCTADLIILRGPSNVCSRPEIVTLSTNCSVENDKVYNLTVIENMTEYTMDSLSTHVNCFITVSTLAEAEHELSYFDTFRTRKIDINIEVVENGVHIASFTCHFAPCVGIRGKCFIDFLDGNKNITIEADDPANLSATHSVEILDAVEYGINVYDVLSDGTVLKEAVVIHTSFSIPLPSTALHTRTTVSLGPSPTVTTSIVPRASPKDMLMWVIAAAGGLLLPVTIIVTLVGICILVLQKKCHEGIGEIETRGNLAYESVMLPVFRQNAMPSAIISLDDNPAYESFPTKQTAGEI